MTILRLLAPLALASCIVDTMPSPDDDAVAGVVDDDDDATAAPDDEVSEDRCTGASLPPLAHAGADAEVLLGYPARLHGGASYHPLGCPFDLRWSQVQDGSDPVTLSNPTEVAPSFTAPARVQTLTFELTATSGDAETVDRVRVLVVEQPERAPPQVQASADTLAEAPLALTASGDDALVHRWTTPGADGRPIEVATGATFEPEAVAAGVYAVEADDGTLQSGPDWVVLWAPAMMKAPAPAAPSVSGPTAVDPGASVTLAAIADGDALPHWSQVAGAHVDIADRFGTALTFTAPSSPGELRFRLEVAHGGVRATPALHTLTVSAGVGNQAPVALAGLDRIVHPGRVFQLDGSGSTDADTDPLLVFTWTQTLGVTAVRVEDDASGPRVLMVAPTFDMAAQSAREPIELVLAFALTVYDQHVFSAPDTLVVVVVPEDLNEPPVAAAGSDREVVSGAVVVLDASASADPEADDLDSYTWGVSPEPPTGLMLSAFAPVASFVAGPPGTHYDAEVEVCDELASCSRDTVTITVVGD